MQDKKVFHCRLFDGVNQYESAKVEITGDIVTEVLLFAKGGDPDYTLLPGLIDAHTHASSGEHLRLMQKNGVTGNCSVAASAELKGRHGLTKTWSSHSMLLGGITDGGRAVERELSYGADYIKVILEDEPRMSGTVMSLPVLRDIVRAAHRVQKKVAVHAVSVLAVEKAMDAGADILLHVPMKEPLPIELAEQAARQGIAVVPTLVMMEAFANSWRFGYKKEDYRNAELSVQRYLEKDVIILAGTDANIGFFTPKVRFGSDLHKEMELLTRVGMAPTVVMKSATAHVAHVFGLEKVGEIREGSSADLLLVRGKPDIQIADMKNIQAVYIEGVQR